MDIVYPIEVEYGDFGIKFTELVFFSLTQIVGLADQEVQKNAGSSESEHYNVRITLNFGEGEAKIEFKDHGILLADGSQGFFKGLKAHKSFILTSTLTT